MIIDTSAIIAILAGEPGARACSDAIAADPMRQMSAGSYLEAAIVVDSAQDARLSGELDHVIRRANITIEPVTENQIQIARQAYKRFGKGTGHLAKLNFGDCFAYALAKEKREPLLFIGDDFLHTDIEPAIKSE